MLIGMSSIRLIPRVLLIPVPLLVCSCSIVDTSSTAAAETGFLPLPYFTSNEPVSLNLAIIFLSLFVVIGSDFMDFNVRNLLIVVRAHLLFL